MYEYVKHEYLISDIVFSKLKTLYLLCIVNIVF